ncbi:class I SAM-dependent methyltransferase [Streptomyces sp. RFCAC02]|uniref:class I SAM-dependent methyltransferase n=1 Tax=Streptomyces sp. RFCAC02 TaxID=2499143 RepID=UPI0010226D6F|nr:class I SAM-dependent methyltransferase [Streptomyces sp. RFCAC02]
MTPPESRTAHLASSFNAVAADYAAARPSYPPALYDAIEELTGRAIAGSRVLDIGAGTGLGTRPLHERGARVTAAEPGAGMAAQFRAALPGVPLLRANGNALPFAPGVFDLVTYAQAWHWTDPARSVPEALRVLRPAGAVALWWNRSDPADPWNRDQEERLRPHFPELDREDMSVLAGDRVRALGLPVTVHSRAIPWQRTVGVDTHLTNLASHSHFAIRAAGVNAPVLAAERAAAARAFPDGRVTERYVVRLTVLLPDGGTGRPARGTPHPGPRPRVRG